MPHYQLSGIALPDFILYIQYIVPGPVSELSYEENTNTSVSITWKPPKEPNGDIVAYFVEHELYQNESTTSVILHAGGPKYNVIQGLGKLLPSYINIVYLALYITSYVHLYASMLPALTPPQPHGPHLHICSRMSSPR